MDKHFSSKTDGFWLVSHDVAHGHFGGLFSFAFERTSETNQVFPFEKLGCTHGGAFGIKLFYRVEIEVGNAGISVVYQILTSLDGAGESEFAKRGNDTQVTDATFAFHFDDEGKRAVAGTFPVPVAVHASPKLAGVATGKI